MSSTLLNIDPETGDRLPETKTHVTIQPNHNYNLRPRLTETNRQYTMSKEGHEATSKAYQSPMYM